MNTCLTIQEIANDLITTCFSFPTLSISDITKENESIVDSYHQKMNSMSKLISLNVEIEKQEIARELESSEREMRSEQDLQKELQQLLIEMQIQRLKYLNGIRDDIICPLLSAESITKENERILIDLIRQRDRFIVKLQKYICEYQQVQQNNCELREKILELQQGCDQMMSDLNEQSTLIQELEEEIDESTKEEQRHNILSAERKYIRQKKENDILRNIYSSLVLVSKLDWSRKDRIRELMLCNEDAPGVPESDFNL